MRIRFNTDPSRFVLLIQAALTSEPEALASGQVVSASVPIHVATKKGFERCVTVTIAEGAADFETDWTGDPSRFGSKLRAAASVLRDLGYVGTFRLEHSGRIITIQRLG